MTVVISQIPATNQMATFINVLDGVASLVTKTQKGYTVTLLDTDAEMIVGSRTYPATLLEDAIAYAKKIANI
jgi:hypothetical protein